jgi:hypothetical protein
MRQLPEDYGIRVRRRNGPKFHFESVNFELFQTVVFLIEGEPDALG